MRFLPIILFLLTTQYCFSQNLVSNGSFEKYSVCPSRANDSNSKLDIMDWYKTGEYTADYFNSCCRNKFMSVPHNQRGYQLAQDGQGYLGLMSYANDLSFEYIQTRLKHPLKEDKLYCVRYYVSLADKSDYYSNNISALFTKEKIKGKFIRLDKFWKKSSYYKTFTSTREEDYFNPQIKPKVLINNYTDWTEVCGVFKAKGGEKYLTIGSFAKDVELHKSDNYNEKSKYYKKGYYIYYYLDNVSVVEAESPEECNCKPILVEKPRVEAVIDIKDTLQEIIKIDTISIGQSIVLNNIYFTLNDSTLLDSSYMQLNKLYQTLSTNPSLKIEIAGHSDNTGSAEYNQNISEARAKAVVNYLIQKGIEQGRLKYISYGNTKPVTSNTTEKGRQQNRRVEFTIIEK